LGVLLEQVRERQGSEIPALDFPAFVAAMIFVGRL
jgi:hypothetical protein